MNIPERAVAYFALLLAHGVILLALSGCASDPRATPASCQTTWMCFG